MNLLLVLGASSELDGLEQTGVGLRCGPLVDGIDGSDHFVSFVIFLKDGEVMRGYSRTGGRINLLSCYI